jgi:peptidoglycan/xylan/chitin deacetylase (PgdA/CDA1 family)
MGRLKEISLKKNGALKALYALVCLACARIVSRPLILCFHRVKVPSESLLDKRVGCISPQNFQNVLRFMRLMGYRFIALEQLVNMITEKKVAKVAAVTFDDGFKDLYENAYPVLKEEQIPFTLFLITSLIDSEKLLWLHKLYILLEKLEPSERNAILRKYIDFGENSDDPGELIGKIIHSSNKQTLAGLELEVSRVAKLNDGGETLVAKALYLSKKEVEEMNADGLTVETHGHEHWPLRSLNLEETRDEIGTSIGIIRESFKSSAKFLALQYGKSNGVVSDVARDLGLTGIATMRGKLIGEQSLDLYSLPRFCIYDNVQSFYRELSIEFLKHICGKVC